MNQPQFALLAKGTTPQPIGSWTRNVVSWALRPSMPRLFVRYEDLIEIRAGRCCGSCSS